LAVTVAMSSCCCPAAPPRPTITTFSAGLEDAVDIEVAVARRLGIRVLLTRGSMNRFATRRRSCRPDSVVQGRGHDLATAKKEKLETDDLSPTPAETVGV